MVDSTALDIKAKYTPEGFSKKSTRRPVKDAPSWVLDQKKREELLFKKAKLDDLVATLYWLSGYTAIEISEIVFGTHKKIRSIESIIYRLKRLKIQ